MISASLFSALSTYNFILSKIKEKIEREKVKEEGKKMQAHNCL